MTTNSDLLTSVALNANGVIVNWNDGYKTHFHSIWLRHSPGFPDSNRPAGPGGRFPRPSTDVQPSSAEISDEGDLKLEWSNGQQSCHPASWLRQHDYANLDVNQRRRAVTHWSADDIHQLRDFDYFKLVQSDQARLPLFEQLLDYGTALIRNVPVEPFHISIVGNWLGHTPANLYADDPSNPAVGDVKTNPNVAIGTNMSHFLGPHTDTCWRQTLSGLVLLHCLKAHQQGGRSIVVDGFKVANRLRQQDESAFNQLSQVVLSFGSKVGEKDDWRVLGRIISTASDGDLEGIRYNGNSIEPLDLPADQIEPTYRALEAFESILYDKSLWWQPMLQPGDLLIVDNQRVLHGRESFDPAAGERHLQTCSVDRDDFHNRFRRIAKLAGHEGWNQRLTAGVI